MCGKHAKPMGIFFHKSYNMCNSTAIKLRMRHLHSLKKCSPSLCMLLRVYSILKASCCSAKAGVPWYLWQSRKWQPRQAALPQSSGCSFTALHSACISIKELPTDALVVIVGSKCLQWKEQLSSWRSFGSVVCQERLMRCMKGQDYTETFERLTQACGWNMA